MPHMLTPSVYSSLAKKRWGSPRFKWKDVADQQGLAWAGEGTVAGVAFPGLRFRLVVLSGWIFQPLSHFIRKGEATDEKGDLPS